jgi:hypothetical protein
MENFGAGSIGRVTSVTREDVSNTIVIGYADENGNHQDVIDDLTEKQVEALFDILASLVGGAWVRDTNGNGYFDEMFLNLLDHPAQLIIRNPHEDNHERLHDLNISSFDFSRADMNFGKVQYQPQLGDLSVQSDILF